MSLRAGDETTREPTGRGAEKRMEPSLLSVGVEPGPKVES